MTVETTTTLKAENSQSPKAETLSYFHDNDFPKEIYHVWSTTSNDALEICRRMVSTLSQQELQELGDNIDLKKNPLLAKIRPEFLTISGSSSEYLTLAYLKIKSKVWNRDFESLTTHFEDIIKILSEDKRLKIEPYQEKHFLGTWITWEKKTVVVPDGFVLKKDPISRRTEVVGIYESHLSNRTQDIENSWMFIELLRSNPELFNSLNQKLFPQQNVILSNDDPQFQFVLATRKDIPIEHVQKAREKGWNVVVRTPFLASDALKITLNLLRNYYHYFPLFPPAAYSSSI